MSSWCGGGLGQRGGVTSPKQTSPAGSRSGSQELSATWDVADVMGAFVGRPELARSMPASLARYGASAAVCGGQCSDSDGSRVGGCHSLGMGENVVLVAKVGPF
jgi:hypothetical protein